MRLIKIGKKKFTTIFSLNFRRHFRMLEAVLMYEMIHLVCTWDFRKNKISIPWYAHACFSRDKKCEHYGKFCVCTKWMISSVSSAVVKTRWFSMPHIIKGKKMMPVFKTYVPLNSEKRNRITPCYQLYVQ